MNFAHAQHFLAIESPVIRKETIQNLNPGRPEVLPVLIIALKDQDKGVRDAAFHALSLIASEEAARALIPLLGHQNIEIRNLANELLIQYGTHAAGPLLVALKDPDKDVRKFAIDILGLSGEASLAEHLIELLDDPEPNVAVSAAEALGNLQNPAVVPVLISHFNTCDGIQPVILEALGKLSCPRADKFLLEIVCQGDSYLSLIAVESLRQSSDLDTAKALINCLPKLDASLKKLALKAIFCILERNEIEPQNIIDLHQYRHSIFEILLEQDDRDAFNAIWEHLPDNFFAGADEEVFLLLNHPDDEKRYLIVERLRSLDIRQVLRGAKEKFDGLNAKGQMAFVHLLQSADAQDMIPLMEKLSQTDYPEVKILLAQLLVGIDHPKAKQILKQFAEDEDVKVQEAAYLVLSYNLQEDSIALFEKGTEHEQETIAESCIHALAEIAPSKAMKRLQKWLCGQDQDRLMLALKVAASYPELVSQEDILEILKHPNPETRILALQVVEKWEGKLAFECASPLLQDPDSDVRLAALNTLIQISPIDADIPIATALEDQDYRVQIAAIEAAIRLDRIDMAPYLYAQLNSGDRLVQIKAIQAILHLMGEDQISEIIDRLKISSDDAKELILLARGENYGS